MFLPRAILVSVGRSIPVLWVRTGSEPDFNPKNSTTSWRDSTVNIFSPESPSLLLKGFVSSLIVSLNLHTYIRLLMKTMWHESSRTDTNGPCDEVFFFFLSDWWETLQITPTMRLQGCVGFCMVYCDAKKLQLPFLFFRIPAVSRLSSWQEMISLHTLSPPVPLKRDTAATTHVRSALNSAASAHRC